MKRARFIILLSVLSLCVSCSSSPQAQTKAQRKPLQKEPREYKTPTNYELRDRAYDPKTGKLITYDHKPRVELIDNKAGKYAFKWIGYDGKEKTVIFQRGDIIDVIVSASVVKTQNGQYLYIYQVRNLPTSATYLKRIIIQNFASDVKPDVNAIFYAGNMSNSIYQFREGNWISFADVSDQVQIDPGQTVTVQLTSFAPPGFVECRASAETTMEGGGEDMPMALENLLPGYEEFPRGHTIGPVDNLTTLSSPERIKYLLEKLPQFRVLGWITDEAAVRYERQLKKNDVSAVMDALDQDLKSEQITTEVFAVIQAMK